MADDNKKLIYEDLNKSMTHSRPRPEGAAPTQRPTSQNPATTSTEQGQGKSDSGKSGES